MFQLVSALLCGGRQDKVKLTRHTRVNILPQPRARIMVSIGAFNAMKLDLTLHKALHIPPGREHWHLGTRRGSVFLMHLW